MFVGGYKGKLLTLALNFTGFNIGAEVGEAGRIDEATGADVETGAVGVVEIKGLLASFLRLVVGLFDLLPGGGGMWGIAMGG